MVSSTTTFTKEQLALVEPQESMMYEWANEFFSRRNFRYAFTDVENIGLHDTHVEEGPKTYLNPDTWEGATGPTEIGETGGAGMDLIEVEGEQYPTYRFTQGFTTLTENVERGAAHLSENRRKIAEAFSWEADRAWFKGMYDRAGNEIVPGMFKWLKSNISDDLTFDCANFAGGEAGDTDDLVSTNTQENILKRYAYANISGRTNDSGVWSVVLGRQKALSHLNARAPSDGGTDPRDTYWARLNADPDGNQNYTNNNVGIQNMMLIPDELKLFEVPPGYDNEPSIDLASELGDNELIILPDMRTVREKYWTFRQMPSPRLFEPTQSEGGQTRFDYAWRMQFNYLPDNRYTGAEDAVHLTNIDQLFV